MLDPDTWDPPGFVKGKMVGAGNGAGWVRFAKRHCGGRLVTHCWTSTKDKNGKVHKREKKHFVFDGSTHLDELNKRLRETVMLRRLKKDVLKDLPPKTRQLIILPRDADSDVIDKEHAAFVASGLDYSADLEKLSKASVEFQELAAARKAVGLAKVPAVVEHLSNCIANGIEAIVVFTHHKEVAWKIADEFLEYQPAVYTGDCTEAMRDLAVRRFQSGETPLFIGTIGAAGVGLTLTRASLGVFAEFQWKDMSQAEDRIHRITQLYPVLLQYLVFDWSVDINMLKLVWKKMKIVEKTLNEQPVSRAP
jgi:SWI/SNF-related matrix-associated actin-dependent regulator 1 of chromatin subfamily A